MFTAGIGEHSPWVRSRVMQAMAWTGLDIDEAANEAGGPRLTKEGSAVSAWRIPTDEEAVLARHARDVVLPAR